MLEYLVPKENVDPNKPEKNLTNIKVWSQIANNFTSEDVSRVRKDHCDKLERYRNRKDWEAWIEEDELDIEGERIIAEIKNYKSEFFFNSNLM